MRSIGGVLLAMVVGAALLVGASLPAAVQSPGQTDPWSEFAGTWVVSGRIQGLAVEPGRQAVTAQLSGAVAFSVNGGLGRGFRGEVIAYDDGSGVTTGRAVWSDERGDRILSTLKGETLGASRRFTGTITSGTGRYAGIAGDYSFEWQYVIAAEGDSFQGRAIGLRGRVRRAAPVK
jgi:opacity protein-like surface antigen